MVRCNNPSSARFILCSQSNILFMMNKIFVFRWHVSTSYTGVFAQDLGLHCKLNKGTLDVSLFCPYWMINKTGKWLAYRVKSNCQNMHAFI